jgi:hypothetical protein
MKLLMKLIEDELKNQNTKVVLVPSAREINHIYPLPQPAYPESNFIRIANPQTFRINDITFGTINADVIKELILSTVVKDVQTPKVELAWQSLL